MLLKNLLVLTVSLGAVVAQVQTRCNPLKRDDCQPNPAFGTDHTWNLDRAPPRELWETTAGVIDYSPEKGAAFTIGKRGDSPTIRTAFYFFFGRTEIWMKAAPGRGIISSMMWLSDDLDEVDWEFLGANSTYATTNFFSKGRQDFHNGGVHPMERMQDDYHNYTIVWTKEQLDWYIDGNQVRSLKAADANKSENYPQNPMRMSLGIWAGGSPDLPEGTRAWAGGLTQYDQGPYTMYVKKVRVTDFSTGRDYAYGDRSGNWQSIKIAGGNSTAADFIRQGSDPSASERWHGLSHTSKIVIGSVAGAIGALALAGLLFYFLRQRRLGAKEARLAEQRAAAERVEMEHFEHKGFDADGYSLHAESGGMMEQRHRGDDSHGSDRGSRRANMSDADSCHVPETTTTSPLAAGAGSSTIAPRPGPRVNSPAPSAASSRVPERDNALGFDFGVSPVSPVQDQQLSSRAVSPIASSVARSSPSLSRSQSPGLPPPGPLPSPRTQMLRKPPSRGTPPSPGPPSPGWSTPDGR